MDEICDDFGDTTTLMLHHKSHMINIVVVVHPHKSALTIHLNVMVTNIHCYVQIVNCFNGFINNSINCGGVYMSGELKEDLYVGIQYRVHKALF